MKGAIEFIVREWSTIGGAPITFVLALVLVGGIIYAALRWQFGARLDQKNDTIDSLERRLAAAREAPRELLPAHTLQERRRTLIAQARAFTSAYLCTSKEQWFGEFMDQYPVFLELKPHLNKSYSKHTIIGRTANFGTVPPVVEQFLAELEALEKQWGIGLD